MGLSTPLVSTLPANIVNGTPNDASQVMADFNAIVNNINARLNASTGAGYVGVTSDSRWGGGTSIQDALGTLIDKQQLTDTGAVNALVVTPAGGLFSANVGSMLFLVNPGHTTTSSTPTLQVGTAPAVTIVSAEGSAHVPGTIQVGIGALLWVDTANNRAIHLNSPRAMARNFFVDPACRVTQNSGTFNLSTSYQYGQVDLVQHKATGTAVSAGTLIQSSGLIGPPSSTGFASRVSGATITGAGVVFARRWLEGIDGVSILGGALGLNKATFSCLVQHNVGSAINYTITINSANAGNNFSAVTLVGASGNISVPSGVPTLISFTVTLPVAVGNGLEMVVQAACGAVTTKNFDFTDWQAVIGSSPLPMQIESFDTDYWKVLRYYEKTYEYSTPPASANLAGAILFSNGIATGNGLIITAAQFRVNKVISPVVTIYNPNSGVTNSVRDISVNGDIAVTINSSDTARTVIANNTGGALTTDHLLIWHYVADARL